MPAAVSVLSLGAIQSLFCESLLTVLEPFSSPHRKHDVQSKSLDFHLRKPLAMGKKTGRCVLTLFSGGQGEDAENIGYVIPVDVVQHFITDFERNGCFTSFPILGIDWQKMESKFLREALGMKVGSEQKPLSRTTMVLYFLMAFSSVCFALHDGYGAFFASLGLPSCP